MKEDLEWFMRTTLRLLRSYFRRMALSLYIIVNIQLVAVAMFKVRNGICPEIMKDLFQLNEGPNGKIRFLIPKVNNEYTGKLSLRYFGPVVWEIMLPDVYKEIKALGKFKEDIKKWVPDCKCRLCKTYISGVGFI